MGTQYPGNAIPAPGFWDGDNTVDQELLFSTVGYVQKGVTLKPGQGVLPLGTGLKQDAGTKQYVKTTTASEIEGLLRQTVDTGADSNGKACQANILYGGVAHLGLVQAANSGVNLANVLGGQVNEIAGFFRF